jgi:hypothetical protein
MTGSLPAAFAPGLAVGLQTLAYRQSSDGAVPSGAASLGNGSCMQSWPYAVAWRTPRHDAGGCGARQRSGPLGGAAKGMPFQLATPSSTAPATLPDSMATTGAAAKAAIAAIAGAASSRTAEKRMLRDGANGMDGSLMVNPLDANQRSTPRQLKSAAAAIL